MGIRGLTPFVENVQGVWKTENLDAGSRVIIDGNAFIFYLHRSFKIDSRYGGQHDRFCKAIDDSFASFKAQKIEVYVIFDGPTVAVKKKRGTLLQRAKDKVQKCCKLSQGITKENDVTPLLSGEALVQKLRSLEIPFVFCDREADQEIASLANHWQCPVISNDSDFFIYDIPGYIPLDHLHHTDQLNSVRRFCHQELSAHLGIPSSFLPLLASLVGNDYVDSEVLVPFEKALREHIQTSVVTSSRIASKVKSICCFLQNATNVDDALQSVLSIVHDDSQKECLKKALVESMAEYDISTETLASYFEGSDVAHSNPDVPEYVVKRHREGYFPSRYLGVIFSGRQILKFQIEDVQQKSASRCSRKLRQVIYGILNRENVVEYDRIGTDVQKNVVKANDRPVRGFDSFPKLESLPDQTDERQRKRFLRLILKSEKSIHSIPEKSQLFVMSIRYWISHAKPRVKERWVQVLILQYLHPSGSVLQTDEATFDLSLQHGLSQWQSVMAEALSLNEILLNAFPEPDMSSLFNGATSQRIMDELSNGKPVEHYDISWDGFQELYRAALDKLDHKLDSSEFTAGKQKVKERKKRSKKKVDITTNRFAVLEISSDDD